MAEGSADGSVGMSTSTKLNVGRAMDDHDRAMARLVRSLSQQPGGWAVIDDVFGEQANTLLCGSAPRLKAGGR